MRARRFVNDGGPLLALDAGDAALWMGGVDPGADGDYGRACASGHPAGLIPVGASSAVVLGAREGIGTAWWQPSADGRLLLVGCVYADDGIEEALPDLLQRDDVSWAPLGGVDLRSGQALLLNASSRLSDVTVDPDRELAVIGDALSVRVACGRYATAACELLLPDKALFNVVRWTPE